MHKLKCILSIILTIGVLGSINTASARFYSVDPVGPHEHIEKNGNVQGFNRYAYANNNPYRFYDPDGRAAETIFDVMSVGIGIHSFGSNISQGHYGGAALDALGIAVDGAAAVVPFEWQREKPLSARFKR